MKVLVCGGRKYSDKVTVWGWLQAIHLKHGIDRVIQGGADGADKLALKWCLDQSIECWNVPADWTDLSQPDAVIKARRDGTKYDAKAGSRRNQRMLDEGRPDVVVAFPGGTGTADMMRRAVKAGVRVFEPVKRTRA
ncbi:SLOG family protein [Candidatus Phyllobacterium onerii]|uniref:SLOG family protein n=1 Tax=Candidatus Phyllobacterium onerii TaxID=3020828 RepID=UPI00232BAA41|nr:SLOG family protein [Phyllobacterium sp. IY22]